MKRPIKTVIPIIVIIILNINAKVLISRALCLSLYFLLLRQMRENIKGRKPRRIPPMKKLMIDHGNQSRIFCISDCTFEAIGY